MTALVQLVAASGAGNLTITISTTAGNGYALIVAGWTTGNVPFHIATITDNAAGGSNTWVFNTTDNNQNPPAAGVYDSGSNVYAFAGIATCLPSQQGSNTKAVTSVTITFSSAPGFVEAGVMEFSGLPAGAVVLAGASTVTLASAVTSYTLPAVTPGATSLGIGMTSDYNGEFTGITTGWVITNTNDTIGCYGLAVGPGAIGPTLTQAAAHDVPTSCILAVGPAPISVAGPVSALALAAPAGTAAAAGGGGGLTAPASPVIYDRPGLVRKRLLW